jgi:aminoglycoside phosphotransferase (APT) family kinase protein
MATTAEPGELIPVGRGREADVFAWDEGRVLRLAHDPAQAPTMDREALVLAAAHRAGAPVPALYERIDVHGRPGLVIQRLDGPDLLSLLGAKPWLVLSVAGSSGRTHAELHALRAPEGVGSVHEVLRARLASELVPPDVRARALELLEIAPDGDRLCHGDFHPGNLLRTRAGDFVIDWTAGTRGDPEADVARTVLLLRLGAVHEDAPTLIKRLDRVGRWLLLGGYLRNYRRRRELDPVRLERWIRIVAAARLGEGIEQERAPVMAVARASGPLV